MKILDWLKLPEAKEVGDLDDPKATLLHARIIQKKTFLKNLYCEHYSIFRKVMYDRGLNGVFVELGSGGGFIKEILPGVITSDIMELPHVDKCFSALNMPFQDNTIDAFFMINVLHHINDVTVFFNELGRCLKTGGRIVIIDQTNTIWGRFVYQHFHHEPFDPSGGWELEGIGPMSSCNGAIPWIVFSRDRSRFEKEFPLLKINKMRLHTPLRYVLSGGVSMRQLLPSFMYPVVKGIEVLLSPLNRFIAMYMTVELEKQP